MSERQTRNVRDTVFVDLFSKDREGRRNFLSVYNALHGTALRYEDTAMEDVHLDNVLYHTFNNDVSMLVDGRVVVLCEHQSTVNENMPLRCLFYIARIYERLTRTEDRFRRRRVEVPFPEFYVFYNGGEDIPAKGEQRLTWAFARGEGAPEPPPLELRVVVYNINRHEEIPEIRGVPPLTEYAEFSRMVAEERRRGGDFIARTIRRARGAGVLAEYLGRRGKEVSNMFFGEYDYDMDIRVQREEAREEGIAQGVAQGIAQGKEETAFNLLAGNVGTWEQIAKATGLPLQRVEELAKTVAVPL